MDQSGLVKEVHSSLQKRCKNDRTQLEDKKMTLLPAEKTPDGSSYSDTSKLPQKITRFFPVLANTKGKASSISERLEHCVNKGPVRLSALKVQCGISPSLSAEIKNTSSKVDTSKLNISNKNDATKLSVSNNNDATKLSASNNDATKLSASNKNDATKFSALNKNDAAKLSVSNMVSSTSKDSNTVEASKLNISNNPLIRVPGRIGDILRSTLKTSLSEVLRKNIEANSKSESSKDLKKSLQNIERDKSLPLVKKEEVGCQSTSFPVSLPAEKSNASSNVEKTADTRGVKPIIEIITSVEKPKLPLKNPSDKTLSKTEIQIRLQNAINNSTKKFSASVKSARNCNSAPIISSIVESSVASIADSEKASHAASCELAESSENMTKVSTVASKESIPSSDSLIQPQNDKVIRNRKSKKRHFKGATYNLYLTPARKRKKLHKKYAADSMSKDDEMSLTSTENGSCIDSSDACSMFSDDFNTSSEKSLADDEACSNSRCSPLLITDQRIDLSCVKIEPPSDDMDSSNILAMNNDSNIKPEPCTLGIAQTNVISSKETESFNNTQSTEKVNCSKKDDNDIVDTISSTVCSGELVNLLTSKSNDDCHKLSQPMTKTVGTRKTVAKSQTNCDRPPNIKYQATNETKKTHEWKQKPLNDSDSLNMICKYPDRNQAEGSANMSIADNNPATLPSPKDEDSSKTITLSTIATSVKSRQRIKRRFTDDIIDTDVGILSLNSMHTSCRKPKADLPPPPQTQDIIESYKINTNTEARGGPVTKVESVFSAKQLPVAVCTCHGQSYEIKACGSAEYYCQAVDSYEDKLVGCSNAVVNVRLIRPSVRIPFTVMCEMHLWRLKQHHSCPRCGIFCSQGTFMQCSAEKGDSRTVHLYHERCQGGAEGKKFNFCLHCGVSGSLKNVHLDCEMSSPHAFYQSQHSLNLPSKARITFINTEKTQVDNPVIDASKAHKITGKDVILSSEGLPVDFIPSVEALITSLNEVNIADIPEYSSIELYHAVLEGEEKKVLFMLAKGVNPNEKFSEMHGNVALHAAAARNNVVITHLLLQSGAVADTLNRNLRTPLIIATERNHKLVAECLVKAKAPLNTKGEVGMTCLHVAARDGLLELCKLYLKTGRCRINAQDDGGWTPIVWASEHGHEEIVKFLIDRGGDPNIRDNEGNTAMHWAAFCGTSEVCVLLLNHGCNVDEANEHGDTPLHISARQDNFNCVDLFLSRSANLNVRNNSNELPLNCCMNNPNGRSARAIQLSMSLKDIFAKFNHRSERILFKDIALGREKYPIRCINAIDETDLDLKEFLYVTENCETCPIKIDRCITSLQRCNCSGDCTLSSCTCAAISFKCWYDVDGHLVPEFNMLDPPLLFECNRACCCDASICRNRVVQKGMTCRLELIRTEGRGWGVRALKDIAKGTFICEYVGELITDSEADTRRDDSYLFDLDNKDGETYCLDARHFGNISRFINHLCEPNLVPVKVFIDHQDLSFPRIAFFSLRNISQYEELGFDYGEKFWVIKSKSFTCNCGSGKCKYSTETIQETLENYNSRIKEDMLDEMDMGNIPA